MVGTALHLLDVPSPLLWGLMATVLNFVPYVGAMVGVAVVSLVSFVTFDEVGRAVVPPLVYLFVTSLEGGFITPLILGRSLSLSPVAILLGLLFWGWLWGIPGALLAVPILLSVRIVCENVPSLAWVAQLLGRSR